MSDYGHDELLRDGGEADKTLRLLARVSVPEGLEERVRVRLRNAPQQGRVLAWPGAVRASAGWLRSAAAAAIVCVVAGGGWGVYSHVQPRSPEAKTTPLSIGLRQGMTTSGVVQIPKTLNGPTVAHPSVIEAAQPEANSEKPVEASSTHVHKGKKAAQMAATGKSIVTTAPDQR